MSDEPQEKAPINDNAAPAPEARSPELDATNLMKELQPQSDNRVGAGLASLEDLSKFPKTDLLGSKDSADRSAMKAEAKDLASVHPFNNAQRFLTRSA